MSNFNTAGVEFIRNEANWDKYDAYASVRSLQYDIAEAWYGEHEECLPGYRPSQWFSVLDWQNGRAERLNNAMEHGIINRDDVEYWWKVLDRMEDLVKLAGRDY